MDAVSRSPVGLTNPVKIAEQSGVGSVHGLVKFDNGSFRDRSARVVAHNGQIYRSLTGQAYAAWSKVSQEPFFQRRMASGQIVDTKQIALDDVESLQLPVGTTAILKHERIPFISYPYEWSFEMLRRAALLHLEILADAVPAGVMLKDASPYNVQFRGTQPVFIDTGSFMPLVPGEPWLAYRQFCELMLFPLLLQSYRKVHFQSLLRSQLEGIPARQFLQWIRWRDMVRPGVFSNGWLQAALERNAQQTSTSTVHDLKSSGFESQMIERMLKKLTRLVERLRWTPDATQWTQYDNSLPHVADDLKAKSEFVSEVSRARQRDLVWDLGCNDGRYSIIVAEHARTVIAMDQDHACIERLFKSLDTSRKNVLPLCVELANPSPGQGWRGRERKRLEDRGRPELVLCLGLIHHLVLAANIPLPDVVEWLADLGGEVVLEFPSKRDAMVCALLRNKHDQYDDYSQESLEQELEKHFSIARRIFLPSGFRTLFHVIPKHKTGRPGSGGSVASE